MVTLQVRGARLRLQQIGNGPLPKARSAPVSPSVGLRAFDGRKFPEGRTSRRSRLHLSHFEAVGQGVSVCSCQKRVVPQSYGCADGHMLLLLGPRSPARPCFVVRLAHGAILANDHSFLGGLALWPGAHGRQRQIRSGHLESFPNTRELDLGVSGVAEIAHCHYHEPYGP